MVFDVQLRVQAERVEEAAEELVPALPVLARHVGVAEIAAPGAAEQLGLARVQFRGAGDLVPVADRFEFDLHADELGAVVLAALVRVVGERQPRRVVVQVRRNPADEGIVFVHGVGRYGRVFTSGVA